MYRGKKIGVSVPAYNEEKLIGRTIDEMPDFVDRIYVVDDASTDRTSDVVREIMKKDGRVELIRHEKNQGVGGAIVSGWKRGLEEGMDVLAVMAGDNQMDPKYLPKLLDPIVEGRAEIAKGTRFHGGYWKEMPWIRLFGTFLLNVLNKIASGYWNVNDPQNGYVAISAEALKKLDLDSLHRGYAFENDVLIKANVAGLRVINVPVRIRYRVGEVSKLKILRFASSTSKFLLKSFLWRVWVKYLRRGHPLGVLYYAGTILIISSLGFVVISIDTALKIFGLGTLSFGSACLIEAWRYNK
ncbi:glycosyl transferase family protein 7 [Thermococcus cleftensis]|uniref:Glycosyl transferase family protein 7 n=1 Tax=Thermococcus cleftensis (strain DSM 27260 / KACC 17922 / CL1) TaxID=163003 RepID=I3ZTJ9_THECF|nr:glycosyltransferase family 2 protein [Thermococcus cleftensis]AFL95033.1 glycosyl transferase family protein 7 [Thermococcus cleftensis]